MGNKFSYVIWTIIVLLIVGILWLIVEPIIWWTPYSEIRLCVRIFLLSFVVNTFATLRLYNSIVQNTRFSIKLRETFTKFMNVIPGFERAIRSLSTSLNNTKCSVDSLRKELSENCDSIEKFTEKLNRNNKK